MPKCRSNDRSPGHAAFDPAIAEVVAAEKFSGSKRAGDERAEAAPETLAEVAPGNVELRLRDDGLGRRGRNGSHARCGGRALSQEIVAAVDLAQRHQVIDYTVAGELSKDGFAWGLRGCLGKTGCWVVSSE